ncbi:MAG: response regulator transcription factor [Rhodospirillaceae bacterium]|nr:response regulator transcription factor [Rhodospirillaceae bacterium]MCA8933622.1 response regulator transcription factor [Rhodospirillaceae bacterium]
MTDTSSMVAGAAGIEPHLLVVEDDERLRGRLRRYLIEQGFVVTVAGSAAQARTQLASMQVDLIVLDVMLPGESGIELTRDLRGRLRTPILLLTARSETEARISGLEAGADDYVTKPFEPRELVLRIRSILRRASGRMASDHVGPVRLGAFLFDPARCELRRGEERIHLTGTEANLLSALALHGGAVLSRDELTRLAQINGSERTVDVQVTRIRRKIEDDPRAPRYLLTVRGEGYVLRTDT